MHTNSKKVARCVYKTQKNGNILPKINNSMNILPKINNSMNILPKINNSMTSVNTSMNIVLTSNDSMVPVLELSTEELSTTYLNSIITLIHQKGSCLGLNCSKCPLSVDSTCYSNNVFYPNPKIMQKTYNRAIKYLITTYGEREAKAMIVEVLI